MAFCGNCGNQLQSDERFCVKCGHDVSANAAPAAVAVAASAAPPVQPMAVAPPVQAAAPAFQPTAVQYAAPGAFPVAMAVPQAPQKRGGLLGTVVVILLVLAAGYYYAKHRTPATPPAPPVTTAQLAQQQNFAGHWENVFGFIEVSNGKWTNNSKSAIQTSTLECDQYSSNNTDLAQMRPTLNGPVQPGAAATFSTFQMGTVADYMNHVNCWIVDVSPATATAATN